MTTQGTNTVATPNQSPDATDSSQDEADRALHDVLDAYVNGGMPSATATAFRRWAVESGFSVAERKSVVVALDDTGRVMAAVGTAPETWADTRDAAWAIVKDGKGMADTGHAAAGRWARALLHLDDDETDAPARRHAGPHVCGWFRVDGVWTCTQDYYAVGTAPETGCGQERDEVGA